MKQTKLRSHCPINFALETFGDRWTLLVVRDMVFYGKRTYGEFLKSEEKIATNILADRLKLLERQGIIRKASHPADKRKDIFLLTDKGLDLIPVLLQIEAWSSQYDAKTDAPAVFIAEVKKDLNSVVRRVRQAVIADQQACLIQPTSR